MLFARFGVYLLPFVRWIAAEHADQAVLIDIPGDGFLSST